jgi:OPT family oligopeptide transporter
MKHSEDEFSDPLEGSIDPGMEKAPLIPAKHDIEATERWWIDNVYRGDKMRQISPRAIVSGMLIGMLMSVSNLYVGLKIGWSLGVTITSCIIAYVVFKSLEAVIPAYRRDPFTILENCTMTSAASAAGYIASAGLVSAFPALYLCTGRPLGIWQMMVWLMSVTILGVFMAVPLKRQLINIDQLPFPSGTATAETLKSLHSTGGKAVQQAKALFFCAIFGSLLKLWVDAWGPIMEWFGKKVGNAKLGAALAQYSFPDNFPLFPGRIGHYLFEHYTIGFEGSVLMIATGAIIGIRIGVSMLIGAFFFYGALAPVLEAYEIIEIAPGKGFRDISGGWTIWPAVALMVASALTAFALRWRTIVRAFSGLTSIFKRSGKKDNPAARVEMPTWWFMVGAGLAGLSCVMLGHILFAITWWMSVLAVLLTFVLAIVAARATGETDITPIGAMGKITQLTYGVIAPSNTTTNLMTAMITAGAASSSADLLTDLKAGYLLGASPRWQTIAQLFGVLAGVLVCVPIFTIIVKMPPFDPNAPVKQAESRIPTSQPHAGGAAMSSSQTVEKKESTNDDSKSNLLSNEFPAPATALWLKVAQLLDKGIKNLPKGSVVGMIIGGVLGILIALAEEFLPKRCVKWIPSATGLGIAGVIPAFNSISMFLGAFAAWIWLKTHRKSAEDYTISGASGLIAGESLTGVSISIWQAAPTIGPAIWRFFFH